MMSGRSLLDWSLQCFLEFENSLDWRETDKRQPAAEERMLIFVLQMEKTPSLTNSSFLHD